jgi:hypothetical protein
MFDERESKQFEIAAELKMLEQQLAALKIAAPSIDRDRLMFAAGRAAAEKAAAEKTAEAGRLGNMPESTSLGRRRWYWPAATATMTAATVLLASMQVWREREATVVRPVVVAPSAAEVREPPHAAVARTPDFEPGHVSYWQFASPPTSGYLGIRYIALTKGVGAIPSGDASGGSSVAAKNEQRASPATVRGLLDEYVPKSSPSI